MSQLPFPFDARSAVELARRLFRNRTAVLQTHFIGSFQAGLLALKPLGAVRKLQIVDHLSGELKQLREPLQTLQRLRGVAAGALVDEYVAVSRFVADPNRCGWVCPPAASGLSRMESPSSDSRSPGAAAESRELPTVVFAGQLIEQKGLHVLLEAAQGMPAAAHWVIAGVGSSSGNSRRSRSASAFPPGSRGRSDSAELLRRADVVVVPSLWDEAFGLVAAEELRRVPVVSDAGGLPEVVGEAGVVVPRGDAQALRSELERLLRSPEERARLGAAALRRAAERFTLRRMIDEHVEAVEVLLRDASTARTA